MARGKRKNQTKSKSISNAAVGLAPTAPNFEIDWGKLSKVFPLALLKECHQNPLYHAEGDVLKHTQMVAEVLTNLSSWQKLPQSRRDELFLATILHDVGKAQTTRQVGTQTTSPGHSTRGTIEARKLLWQLGIPPEARERICSLIRHHMFPHFLVENASKNPIEARRRVLWASLSLNLEDLYLLARADSEGRQSEVQNDGVALELFSDYCRELDCFNRPYPFPSEHSRFCYFQKPTRDPNYQAYDTHKSRVVLMHGLPGVGKDTYIQSHFNSLPMVSLDEIRKEINVPAGQPQGAVIRLARERAKEHLRLGQDFVWNATSISRAERDPLIKLFANYNARIEIVALEVGCQNQKTQNADREEEKIVPQSVIERMLSRWEFPDLSECHNLNIIEN